MYHHEQTPNHQNHPHGARQAQSGDRPAYHQGRLIYTPGVAPQVTDSPARQARPAQELVLKVVQLHVRVHVLTACEPIPAEEGDDIFLRYNHKS